MGIVRQGRTRSWHFGELTKGQGNKPTDQTIYEIASVSKTMVGLLAARAIKDGKLDLDKNINVYLDNQLDKVSSEKSPITIKQLMSHSSGLPFGFKELGLEWETLTKQAFITKLNEIDTSQAKGSRQYSSAGSELLCHILERVYQKPFDQLLTQVFSEELGMKSTQVNIKHEQMPYFAYGYNDKGEVARAYTEPYKLWGGSGYIKSTMSDLIRYMQYQLQEERADVALSHSSIFEYDETQYSAYFWLVVQDKKLGRFVIHHGGLEGTQNWMILFPDSKFAISVVSNTSFPGAADILRDFALDIAALGTTKH